MATVPCCDPVLSFSQSCPLQSVLVQVLCGYEQNIITGIVYKKSKIVQFLITNSDFILISKMYPSKTNEAEERAGDTRLGHNCGSM